jgi:hypothetical protein
VGYESEVGGRGVVKQVAVVGQFGWVLGNVKWPDY